MRAIGWLRRNWFALAWGLSALANLAAMRWWPDWETIPFYLIWVSLTLLYGFRPLQPWSTVLLLGVAAVTTGALIGDAALHGDPMWGWLAEGPLLAAMCVALVWHVHRSQAAEQSQRRLLEDASHEFRTPVTIARSHLELAGRDGVRSPQIDVALAELARLQRITERLLLLARAEHPDPRLLADVDVESALEDVFIAWADTAPRGWRLGPLPAGTIRAAPDCLRIALDLLLENAVSYTKRGDLIALRARAHDHTLDIEVQDSGPGVPAGAVERIFDRFGRADPSRSRITGGAGLGLAIVTAVARAHHGRCTVRTSPAGSTFSLSLPGFRPALPGTPAAGNSPG